MLNAQLTDKERQQFQAIAGQLNWASSQTRPHISYQACEISTSVKNATINDFKTAHKSIRKPKNSEVILETSGHTGKVGPRTQDPKVGPGTQDPKVRL